MHLKFLSVIIIMLLCLTSSNLSAQCIDVLDSGECDTLAIVIDVDTSQMLITAELYMYSDYNIISGTVGFTWIHSTADFVMDSAVVEQLVDDSWHFYITYENNNINLTNTNKRFLFGGGLLDDTKLGIPGDASGRRLLATYYFTLQSWSGMDVDSIQIDTLTYNGGTVYLFIEGTLEDYQNHYKNIWDNTFSVPDDLDSDSIVDYIDNCKFDYNTDQEDTDNDGIGDACCCIDERGNVDGISYGGNPIDVADISYLVDYVFKGGEEPGCPDEGNADGITVSKDLPITVADIVYLVNYLFKAGPIPPDCP